VGAGVGLDINFSLLAYHLSHVYPDEIAEHFVDPGRDLVRKALFQCHLHFLLGRFYPLAVGKHIVIFLQDLFLCADEAI
jgi:hypothetical protein